MTKLFHKGRMTMQTTKTGIKIYHSFKRKMFREWLTNLFEVTLELDGSLNKLNTETIDLHFKLYRLSKLEEKRK